MEYPAAKSWLRHCLPTGWAPSLPQALADMPPSIASQAPPHPKPMPPRLSCCSREAGARRARDVDLKFVMPELLVVRSWHQCWGRKWSIHELIELCMSVIFWNWRDLFMFIVCSAGKSKKNPYFDWEGAAGWASQFCILRCMLCKVSSILQNLHATTNGSRRLRAILTLEHRLEPLSRGRGKKGKWSFFIVSLLNFLTNNNLDTVCGFSWLRY